MISTDAARTVALGRLACGVSLSIVGSPSALRGKRERAVADMSSKTVSAMYALDCHNLLL